jgi:hypothetical protein
VVAVREADNGSGVVLVLTLYCNQKMIIDPVESLLMIWHPTKEIDHAHFILPDQ